MKLFLLLLLLLNCTTVSDYLKNRKNDFLDIFNIGIEKNIYGIGIHGLPITDGLQYATNAEGIGIRYGHVGKYYSGGREYHIKEYVSDKEIKPNDSCFKDKTCFEKFNLRYRLSHSGFGSQFIFFLKSIYHEPKQITNRNKSKLFLKMVVLGPSPKGRARPVKQVYSFFSPYEPKEYTYFPFELSVGVYVGVRVGFTITEFFDFFLGIIGIDFMEDDIPNEKVETVNFADKLFTEFPKPKTKTIQFTKKNPAICIYDTYCDLTTVKQLITQKFCMEAEGQFKVNATCPEKNIVGFCEDDELREIQGYHYYTDKMYEDNHDPIKNASKNVYSGSFSWMRICPTGKFKYIK